MTIREAAVSAVRALSTQSSRKWRLTLLVLAASVVGDAWVLHDASRQLAAQLITASEWAATVRAVLEAWTWQLGVVSAIYSSANVLQKHVTRAAPQPSGGDA